MTREELWKNLVKAGYHCYEKGTKDTLTAPSMLVDIVFCQYKKDTVNVTVLDAGWKYVTDFDVWYGGTTWEEFLLDCSHHVNNWKLRAENATNEFLESIGYDECVGHHSCDVRGCHGHDA